MRGFYSIGLAAAVFVGTTYVHPARADGWDPKAFAAFEAHAFSEGESFRTDALIVTVDGKTVIERYGRGYTATTPHYGWSIGKSVSMAILGAAEADGFIRREDSVSKWIPEAVGTGWDRVLLKHLVSMSSGSLWREGYENSPFSSHVVSALYRTKASRDFGILPVQIGSFVASPGERFNYSSAETNLYLRILKKALGDRYETYPWDRIFTPLGMDSVVMERDQSGTFLGSSYVVATARDFAKFGALFLARGKTNGKQVLPVEWVNLASMPSPAMSHLRLDHSPETGYGHGWWINRPNPGAQFGKTVADLPADAYMAMGHDGQVILVVPSWNLTLVRLANDRFGNKLSLEKIGTYLKAARK